MPFPDQEYLQNLIKHLETRVKSNSTTQDLLLMYSGAAMNWIADFVLDESVEWEKREMEINQLTLTGTNPQWNKIILEQAERSPEKLRELIINNQDIANTFKTAEFNNAPILVRFEDEKYSVLDGMHRVVAAIRDGKKLIAAYTGTPSQNPKPMCEPHVVYDLLKVYHRGLNRDRAGLIAALKFLKQAYVNVEDLLTNRFGPQWIANKDIQEIITEVLKA